MKRSINHIPNLNGRTMRHFGLKQTGLFDCKKAQSVRSELGYNIEQGKITLLIGRYESGKTMLVKALKRELQNQVHFIDVPSFDEDKIKMGSILKSIVDELGSGDDAHPKRDMLARSKQVVRLLGKKLVTENKHTCVVVDNTPDRIHLNTMNALKLVMEADYAGYSPLVSFIILGWPEFKDRLIKRHDIMHRVQTIELDQAHGWFVYAERVQYLEEVFGEVLTGPVRERIARLYHLPGDMNAFVVKYMEKARLGGYKQLNDDIVKPSLKEHYDGLKQQYPQHVSYSIIADLAGVGKSTVSLAIESEPPTKSTEKVRKGMDALESDLGPGKPEQQLKAS